MGQLLVCDLHHARRFPRPQQQHHRADADNLPLVIVHFAVPADVTAYDTDPVPEPPVKLSVMSVPAVPVVPESMLPLAGEAFVNVRTTFEEADM